MPSITLHFNNNKILFIYCITFLVFFTCIGCRRSSDTRETELRSKVERLELELERQKLPHINDTLNARDLNSNGPFLEVPAKGMSDKVFIEWHRNFQDLHESTSTQLQYKNMLVAHPTDPIYRYLYARTIDAPEERIEYGREMIKKWPNFAYGYLLLGADLAYEKGEYQEALKHLRQALALDPDSPAKISILELEKAVEAANRLDKISLTYDAEELNSLLTYKFQISSINASTLGCTVFEQSFNRYTGHTEWYKKLQTKIKLTFLGAAPIQRQYRFTGQISNTFLGFVYEIESAQPINVKILKIGISDQHENVIFINKESFKTGAGRVKIFLNASQACELKEFQITRLYL